MAAASLALVAAGAMTVRREDARPTTENLAYVTSVDTDSAWLVAPSAAMREGSFSLATLGPTARMLPVQSEADSSMRWIQSAMNTTRAFAMCGEARTIADGQEVAVVADSVVGDRRRLALRFTAPSGTLAVRVNGAAYVRALAIDGIALDSARYRSVPSARSIPFTASPDSGFAAVIEAPADSAVVLRLA